MFRSHAQQQAAAPAPSPPAVAAPAKVALLLPLTGSQAALGRNLQHGAELAVMEMGRDNFTLLPRDSGNDPAAAAREVIASGAQLIIGPLFSSHVEAVKPIAAAAHVPVLALSNDWRVAGGGVYVMGFSPVEQVQRMANFAMVHGLHNVGVLAPASAYGDLVIGTLKMPGSPVDVTAFVRYQNNAASIAAAVQDMAQKRSMFQALFIADGGENLKRLASQLSLHNLTPPTTPLLGTSLLEDADAATLQALNGGWYAVTDSSARTSFAERYQKNFGEPPSRLASLAYDATALAIVLAGKGSAMPFNEGALTNTNGFAGLDGVFRLNITGAAEHQLQVMEIAGTGVRVIDSAPGHF